MIKWLHSWIETLLILSDRKLVHQLRQAREDARQGKTVPLRSLRK